MREGDRVEELDLNEWVLRVDIEVDVDHEVEDDHEPENHKVRPNALHFANAEDRGKRD